MSEEKKTPKLSEEVKKRDADKFCMPMGDIYRVIDGKKVLIKAEDLLKTK